MGQTTLGRTFASWQLHTGLDNSPALGLRVIHSQSSEGSGDLVHSLRLTPDPVFPRHPMTTPSPPPAFCMGPPFKNNQLKPLAKENSLMPTTSQPGRRLPWNVGGGHQAVYDQASREIRAATFFGERHNSLCGKGSRAGQLRGFGLSFPIITTTAFMRYE